MKYQRFKKSYVDVFSGIEIPYPAQIYSSVPESLVTRLDYMGNEIRVSDTVTVEWCVSGGASCYVRIDNDGAVKYYRFISRYEFECWLLGTFYGIAWPEVMRHPKFGECTMSRWMRIGGDYYRNSSRSRKKDVVSPDDIWF